MQRRAVAAYLALLLVVSAGSYAVAATSSPPDIDVAPDHPLREGQSVSLDWASYTVTALDASAPSATLEWTANGTTESATLQEGTNVTLGGTTYTTHFEGRRLQHTGDQKAYIEEVRAVGIHERLMGWLGVVGSPSAITAVVLAATAFMPVRGE